ncbi:MAG: hypothetical protein ABL921_08810 [Pirellula sp.]
MQSNPTPSIRWFLAILVLFPRLVGGNCCHCCCIDKSFQANGSLRTDSQTIAKNRDCACCCQQQTATHSTCCLPLSKTTDDKGTSFDESAFTKCECGQGGLVWMFPTAGVTANESAHVDFLGDSKSLFTPSNGIEKHLAPYIVDPPGHNRRQAMLDVWQK